MYTLFDKQTRPLWIVFVLVTGMLALSWKLLPAKNINPWVVFTANALLLGVSLLNIAYHRASLKKKNPQAVLRSVMASTMVKLFVLAALAMIYLLAAGSNRSVYAVILSMGLYIIYSWMETKILLQLKSHQ
jgi:Ni/Fe-hydrogenase subunit HybB-like protein